MMLACFSIKKVSKFFNCWEMCLLQKRNMSQAECPNCFGVAPKSKRKKSLSLYLCNSPIDTTHSIQKSNIQQRLYKEYSFEFSVFECNRLKSKTSATSN